MFSTHNLNFSSPQTVYSEKSKRKKKTPHILAEQDFFSFKFLLIKIKPNRKKTSTNFI